MPGLLSIAEQAWRQLFPNPGDEGAVQKEVFFEDAKIKYAFFMWRKIKEDKAEYGESIIPSFLLSEAEMEVKNNKIDISSLDILRSIDLDMWLQNVGGIGCECKYIKTTHNLIQALCDDDSHGNDRRVYPLGKYLVFPDGVHKDKLTIIYAHNGKRLNEDEIDVDEALGSMVRDSLIALYGGKVGA